jgi:hypothetical protein
MVSVVSNGSKPLILRKQSKVTKQVTFGQLPIKKKDDTPIIYDLPPMKM